MDATKTRVSANQMRRVRKIKNVFMILLGIDQIHVYL